MKYSLLSRTRHRLKLKSAIVHLQGNLNYIPIIKSPEKNFVIKELDVGNDNEIATWAQINQNAFGEDLISIENARKQLINHFCLDILCVLLLYDDVKPIGTIASGTYIKNANIGAITKFAIVKDYQGIGLGGFLLYQGYKVLKDKGVKYASTIFSTNRVASLNLHFKFGFHPVYNKKYMLFNSQKRFKTIKILAVLKLKCIYRRYLKSFHARFL
jgi:GNAT superfamily N-acetyltransferase